MLEKAMSGIQQCVTRHDSVLSAATNDNSATAPTRRRAQVPPAQMSRPTESASCDMARQLHNIRMIETPQAAPPSTQTSASVRQQPAPQSLTAPRTHGPATAQLADGQLWSDLASAVASCYRSSGRWLPDTKVPSEEGGSSEGSSAESYRPDEELSGGKLTYITAKIKATPSRAPPENGNCSSSTSRRRRT